MAAPPSQALTKRSAETSLMPPPPPPKRIKRPAKVLDEDTYTDAISHIIARDFFPGLLETQTQQDYLDALESRDRGWIAEAGKKLTEVMTPGRVRGRRGTSMTPSMVKKEEAETPRHPSLIPAASPGEKTMEEVDLELSLGAFQAKYTSEDNASFNDLLDSQNAKERQKHAWLWNNNKLPSKQQLAQLSKKQKLLEAGEAQRALDQKYNPELLAEKEKQVVLRPSTSDEIRPATITERPSQPRNAFMFGPDSMEDTHVTVAQAAEDASLVPPKRTNYSATRFINSDAPTEPPVPPSPSFSAVQDAIAGRPRASDTDPGYTGAETPRVNGYTFVDEEPAPGENERPPSPPAPDDSLLSRLGVKADLQANPFHLKEQSKRESLHHAMVDRAAAKNRRLGSSRVDRLRSSAAGGLSPSMSPSTGRTPAPKFASAQGINSRRAGLMTPAAQRLLEKVGTPTGRHVGGRFGEQSSGKERWKAPVTPKSKR